MSGTNGHVFGGKYGFMAAIMSRELNLPNGLGQSSEHFKAEKTNVSAVQSFVLCVSAEFQYSPLFQRYQHLPSI